MNPAGRVITSVPPGGIIGEQMGASELILYRQSTTSQRRLLVILIVSHWACADPVLKNIPAITSIPMMNGYSDLRIMVGMFDLLHVDWWVALYGLHTVVGQGVIVMVHATGSKHTMPQHFTVEELTCR